MINSDVFTYTCFLWIIVFLTLGNSSEMLIIIIKKKETPNFEYERDLEKELEKAGL